MVSPWPVPARSGRPSRWSRGLCLLVALIVAALPPGLASAATDTDTFNVTATVDATCVITANDLDFGTYDPAAGGDHNGTTTLDVVCTDGTDYEVGLDAGTGGGAVVAARLMAQGGDTLTYSLYQDGAHSTVWGETLSTDTVAGSGNGATQVLTVHGQIPSGQFVPSGTYSDVITVTITY